MNARTVATVAAVLVLCGQSLAARADEPIGPATPILTHDDGCGKAQVFRQLADAGLGPNGESMFPLAIAAQSALGDTDVTHVDLDIEVDFGTSELDGTCTTDITSTVNGLTEYTFRLRSQFNVSAVTVDGVPAAWVTNSTTTKTVTLPVTKNAGESFQLVVSYDGPTVSGFFGSIEWTDAGISPWWVNDPMVYTLSQPYYAYTWWPAKDGDVGDPGDYADKFTLDTHITAPSQFSTAGMGTLTGIDAVPGGKSRYNYSHNYEIPTYLVAFATSLFNTYSQTWNYGPHSMPVEIMFTQGNDSAQARADWFVTLPMLTAFSDLLGIYPFVDEKYGMYEFGFGGGMEHQTNTGQLAAPGYTGLEWLTAHELMHQWFGDFVTCRTWHDIFINEGMASYGEALWEENQNGFAALAAYQTGDNMPSTVNDTVYVYDVSDANRIFDTDMTYLKGSWVFHMLRGYLGDAAFFSAMQDFLSWYGESGATTEDLRASVEASTGESLTQFFSQWIYNPGAPDYRYSWRSDSVNGQDYLRLRIRQTQPEPVYQMPVRVKANGSDELVAQNTMLDQYFVIPTGSSTGSIAFDPDRWILRDTSPVNEAYTNGPPVVIGTAASDSDADVTFIEGVNLVDGDFSVVTADVFATPVPFTLTYNGGTNTANLDFGGALPNGDYLVTVFDTVDSQAAGVALDGEPGALPSGDGAAGGDFSFVFNVSNPCPADLNGDGVVDNGDIGVFITFFLAQNPAADFNGDGIVDNGDIGFFITAFLAGC